MDFRTSVTIELSALLDRLNAAAEATALAARDEATAAGQVRIDELEAERAALARTVREQTDARQGLERINAALDTEIAEIRRDAEALRARVAALQTESDARRLELDTLRVESNDLRADANALRSESNTLRAEADALRAQSHSAHDQLQAQLDDALRAAADTAARANAWRDEQGRTIRDQAVALVSRTLDRLLAVSAAFANVSTEDDVLAAVVEALATEFPRVALFKAGLNKLETVQHVGFAFPADPTHLVIPQAIGAVLDRAVTSGQIEMLPAEALEALGGTPFGGSAACALALPIDLEGDICAVLYADDSGQPHQAFAATDLRRTYARLLRQLAAPLLVRLPAETKAIAELREYAAHLVAELENMYAADVAAHRKGQELRRRLLDNLECARGIYAQRVSSETPAASALLEEELALAASVAHATPFGRDLMALLGAAVPRAAEA